MRLLAFATVFALLLVFENASAQTNSISKSNKTSENDIQQPTIKWLTLQEAIEKNKKQPKKVFIDVYTDWCGWCMVMDKQTFTNPLIIEYMNANFYAVKMNAEKDETINFKGKEYGFVAQGGRGYHQLAAELMQGKMSYPTVIFLDEKMDLLQPIPGFRKPAELDMILKFFGGDHYKNISYDVFQQKYQSPFSEE